MRVRLFRWVPVSALWLIAGSVLWWSWDRGRPYREEIQLRLDVKVEAAPLVGRLIWHPRFVHLVPVIIGALIIWGWPAVARRATFGWASTIAAFSTGSFAVALAATDGLDRIMDPVVDPTEYWTNLDRLPSVSEAVARWSDFRFLLDYTTHLKGHPPGYIIVLQLFELVGLSRPWVVATLSWLSLAAVTPGVMLLVRQLVDEQLALAAAPFLALAPFAVWSATSADAFFAVLLVWGCVCAVVALRSESKRTVALAACGSGVVLGFELFSTYGAAVAMVIPLAVVVSLPDVAVRRRVTVALLAGAGALTVTGAFLAAGFWWFDGLETTKDFYNWGTAQFRPQSYFVVANVAVLLIALGPAFLGGLSSIGRSRLWVLVAAAIVAVAVANLSGYSKAETERIWLIFMPFLMTAAAAVRRPKLWLSLQLLVAVILQMWLRTKW
jgi:methylthioxylose transferase